MKWVVTDYPDDGRPIVKRSMGEFAFDGEKLRWDRTFDPYVVDGVAVPGSGQEPVHKAYNGSAVFEYSLRRTPGDSDCYVRDGNYDKAVGEMSGERVDWKRIASPFCMPVADVRRFLAQDPTAPLSLVVKTATKDTSGVVVFEVALSPRKNPEMVAEISLTVVPAEGCAIVEEVIRYEGERASTTKRTFQQYGDMWFIKTFDYEGMSAVNRAKPAIATHGEIVSFSPNEAVSSETFELEGLGLPDNTRIWDRVAGIDYIWRPEQALRTRLTILDAERDAMSPPLPTPGGGEVTVAADSAPVSRVTSSSTHQKAPVSAMYTAYVGVGAGIVTIAAILWWLRLRKRTH